MQNVFNFKAINGRINFGNESNRERFAECLRENEGRIFRIEIVKPKRSLSQNALYWVYLSVIERETGNFAEDLHEFFKAKLLPKRFVSYTDDKGIEQEVQVSATTTKMRKAEFSEYMEKIAVLTGIPIPDPKLAGYV